MKLPRISPETAGIASQHVLDFLQEAAQKGIELHSFQFLRGGRVFAEGWFHPYTKDDKHVLFSFTKSFTSTAIGFAWQEGLIRLDERLIDLFPDKSPKDPCDNLRLCTVRDLLAMGCGHETEIDWSRYEETDWIHDFLHHPFPHKPGTKFMYNTAGTNLLVEILRRKTGQGLTEYLAPRLLAPLGIHLHCFRIPGSIEMGGAGGFATTEDMACFMQFVANGGLWEGKQLLKKEWFLLATAKQIDNAPAWADHWSAGYGFQFWMCAPKNTYRADGAFGQFGIVCPDEDAVFIITAAATNAGSLVDMLFRHIKDHFQPGALPADAKAGAILHHVCENLCLRAPLSQRNHLAVEAYNGLEFVPKTAVPVWSELIRGAGMWDRFVLSQNPPAPYTEEIRALSVRFDEDSAVLTAHTNLGTQTLPVSMESRYSRFTLDGRNFAAVGGWTCPNEFCFDARCVNAATGTRFTLRFTENSMALKIRPSIPEYGGLGDKEREDILFDRKAIEN